MQGIIGANATAAYMLPGTLVMNDTNDNEVKEAGSDPSDNIGILGYEDTPIQYQPTNRTTAYAVGDHVAIHNTPGMRFRGYLRPQSTAVTPGKRLVGALDSSGNFILYAVGTQTATRALAMALESITPGNSSRTACWMQWLGE
jgi:hypothetical protein